MYPYSMECLLRHSRGICMDNILFEKVEKETAGKQKGGKRGRPGLGLRNKAASAGLGVRGEREIFNAGTFSRNV